MRVLWSLLFDVAHYMRFQPLRPKTGLDGRPPLPPIFSDEIRLQVYTHRSYAARPTHRFEDLPDDPSPDNEKWVLPICMLELCSS